MADDAIRANPVCTGFIQSLESKTYLYSILLLGNLKFERINSQECECRLTHSYSHMEKSILNGRECGADVEAVHKISNLLETGLSKRVLTVLLTLLEQGYSAESLVHA